MGGEFFGRLVELVVDGYDGVVGDEVRVEH